MRQAPGSRDTPAPPSDQRATVPDDLLDLDAPFDQEQRADALRLADKATAPTSGIGGAESRPPPVPMSDPWPDDERRLDRAALDPLSRPSWDHFQPDEDRFTFPPPISNSNASSVAPVAMSPEGTPEVAHRGGLRWSTLLIALSATLGMSALVLAVDGAATHGGSDAWGWNWKSAPQATGASFGACGPEPEDARESLPGGLPVSIEQARQHAVLALDGVAARASEACASPGMTPTSMRIVATFGDDGRVLDSRVEPLSGSHTRTLRCVGELLRAAAIQPFEGASVSVSRTVRVP